MHRLIDMLRRRIEDLRKGMEYYLQLLACIAEKYGGEAYLFGSRARGEALPSSDVDVLILVPQGVDETEVFLEARRAVRNRMVEIVVIAVDDVERMWLLKHFAPVKRLRCRLQGA